MRTVTGNDVRAVQDAARELVRAQALQRARGTSLQARGLSDFVRVTRVEGLALGSGVAQRLGGGLRVAGTARYAFADQRVRGSATIAWERASGAGLSLRAERQLGEIGAVAEGSMVRNSFAAQEFGSDWTSPFQRRQVVLRADLPPLLDRRWRVAVETAIERHSRVNVNASPSRGSYEDTPAVTSDGFARASLLVRRPTALAFGGTEVSTAASFDAIRVRSSQRELGRATLDLDVQRPFGRNRLVLRTIASGVVGAEVPLQYETWLGGPVTLPGMDFHAVRGRAGLSQRIEWQSPVPAPTIPLGRYGRVPGQLVLAPFALLAITDGRTSTAIATPRGVYPAVGLGAIGLFNLLRVDVARGLRDGRWMFSIDVTRDFWRVL